MGNFRAANLRTVNFERLHLKAALSLLPLARTMPGDSTDFRTRSFAFACATVRFYLAIQERVPRVLAQQVLRAGTAIGANLEEARSAQSRRDLVAKFSIALGEARETNYWIRILRETNIVPDQLTTALLKESDELTAILTTSIIRLKGTRKTPLSSV